MHKNIKLCIDTEFDKEPSQVLEFSQIVRLCVGENYSILLRFYEEQIFVLKEIVKERIKDSMTPNFCDQILFQCIHFYHLVDLFMSKEYDVMESIELNINEIQKKIDKDKLQQLIQWTRE